jgi:hypothetical protein
MFRARDGAAPGEFRNPQILSHTYISLYIVPDNTCTGKPYGKKARETTRKQQSNTQNQTQKISAQTQ